MRQATLFDGADLRTTAPHNGSPTSRAAAEAIAPQVKGLQLIVLQMLENEGPQTNQDIADNSVFYRKMPLQTVCARINELTKAGCVASTRTSEVQRAAIREITPLGRKALLEHERAEVAKRTGVQ